METIIGSVVFSSEKESSALSILSKRKVIEMGRLLSVPPTAHLWESSTPLRIGIIISGKGGANILSLCTSDKGVTKILPKRGWRVRTEPS